MAAAIVRNPAIDTFYEPDELAERWRLRFSLERVRSISGGAALRFGSHQARIVLYDNKSTQYHKIM